MTQPHIYIDNRDKAEIIAMMEDRILALKRELDRTREENARLRDELASFREVA